MTTPELSPLDLRQVALANAIYDVDEAVARDLIEEGVSLAGVRVCIDRQRGKAEAIEKWLSDGLPPLTWVVARMLQLESESAEFGLPRSFNQAMAGFGLSQAAAETTRDAELTTRLDALATIGGHLLIAGANADVRMGRTARSQKALDALRTVLPEHATSMRNAANQRLLQALVKKHRPNDIEEEPYRPKL
jgi:hypothetical protein